MKTGEFLEPILPQMVDAWPCASMSNTAGRDPSWTAASSMKRESTMKRSSLLVGMVSLLALLGSVDAMAEQWARTNQAPDPFIRNVRIFSNTPTTGQTTLFVSSLANGVAKVV